MATLGSRFLEAIGYAAELHADQKKKGTDTPYLSHLMAVTALVLEDGGGEDEAIAALLHDAVEDQGGRPRLGEIRRRFGDAVAHLVEGCTDSFTIPKAPWLERKRAYVEHARHLDAATLRVSAADKLANATALLRDYHKVGDEWQKLDYDNMAKVARAVALGVYRLADSAEAPRWNRQNPRTDRFIRAREKALAGK